MSTATIGFVPRERFSLAAEALRRIFDCTHIPFNLVVVDCNIPQAYWRQMEEVLKGRENITVLHRDHYLLPNQSRNLVIQEARDEFVCLIENDVLVQDDWLSRLIKACEEHVADVAVPLILEGPVGEERVHFDSLLGDVREVEGQDGVKLEIRPRISNKDYDRGSECRTIQFMEQHCVLFRRSILDRISLYDEGLNTRDEIDLALALHHANARVVFEPKCEVHYIPPYPPDVPRPDELEYFFMKWDIDRAKESRDRIQKKWNLVACPGDMGFVRTRNLIGQMPLVRGELLAEVSPNESFILVDDEEWRGTEIFAGLRAIPFLEKEGEYWGLPADDDTAIRELERLCKSGARYIVFVCSSFWWLDHYSKFSRHLRSAFHCSLDNDRLVIFDLQAAPQEQMFS